MRQGFLQTPSAQIQTLQMGQSPLTSLFHYPCHGQGAKPRHTQERLPISLVNLDGVEFRMLLSPAFLGVLV